MEGKSVDQGSGAAPETNPDLATERNGATVTVWLGRTRALNALTIAMRDEFAAVIPRLARDPNIYALLIRSRSPKAFSAGGDVRELIALHRQDPAAARAAFAREYALNWTLECFSKPTISFIDGLVMGSGVGISLYNTHRVAGPGYRFGMPETAIGLFPDVGVAHALSRLPGEVGTYLGLTGRTIGRADAYRLGLATHCISSEHFDEIAAALADAQPVDPLLDDRHVDPGPGELVAVASVIAHCFAGDSVEAILARLEAVTGPDQGFAAAVLADLGKRSPMSLKVTLRHLRHAARMDLREVLTADQRLACRCLEGHDFAEGVRAALVDKDNLPVWRPATLADATASMIEAYFAPLPDVDELVLPTRAEMQAARV